MNFYEKFLYTIVIWQLIYMWLSLDKNLSIVMWYYIQVYA